MRSLHFFSFFFISRSFCIVADILFCMHLCLLSRALFSVCLSFFIFLSMTFSVRVIYIYISVCILMCCSLCMFYLRLSVCINSDASYETDFCALRVDCVLPFMLRFVQYINVTATNLQYPRRWSGPFSPLLDVWGTAVLQSVATFDMADDVN